MSLAPEKKNEITAKLEPWLQKRLPQVSGLRITDIETPGMGMSNETYFITCTGTEAGAPVTHRHVLRSAPRDRRVFPDYHLPNQYRIMAALAGSTVPVPVMRWLEEDPSIFGAPFYLMDRLDFVVPQDFPSYHASGIYFDATPDERATIWWRSLETMAAIHRLDWKARGLSFLGEPGPGTDAIDRQIAYWRRFFEWIKDTPSEEHPLIEAGLAWMHRNRYEPERIRLCWGDARIGNTLYRAGDFSVVAAVDWEMAFLGDPEADLAWFCFMDRILSAQYNLARLDGSPSYDETVVRWSAITGWPVAHYHFNEVFAATRFAMILISVLKNFRNQGIPIAEEMLTNNVATQALADLLHLPKPGEVRTEATDFAQRRVTIQFELSGAGGRTWHVVADHGVVTHHEGPIDAPDCRVKATAADWEAIQTGSLNRLDAWKNGRLVTEGDMNILIHLESELKN